MDQQFSYLRVRAEDAVAYFSFNRPDKRNAQNSQMLVELREALRAVKSNPDIRVVVLAGEGEHFSAGHDLRQAQSERASLTADERWQFESTTYYDVALELMDLPKPTIARVQGACIAAGFMLANMCDLIVASDDAYFSDPVLQTMSAAAVEVLIHPWVLGLRRAKAMLFLGEKISANDALQIGMVTQVVGRSELDAAVLKMAQRIASADPFALMLTKRSLNRSWDAAGLRTALAAHFDTHQLSHHGKGMQAHFARGIHGAVAGAKALETLSPPADSKR